jgi:hypothetical protein
VAAVAATAAWGCVWRRGRGGETVAWRGRRSARRAVAASFSFSQDVSSKGGSEAGEMVAVSSSTWRGMCRQWEWGALAPVEAPAAKRLSD